MNVEAECSICGDHHLLTVCPLIEIKSHIPDALIPPKAHLTIPSEFRIEKMSDNTYSVITKVDIAKGTVLGPLEAEKFLTLDPLISFPLKLFLNDKEDFSEYYLDTVNETTSNWMIFIAPALNSEEQNLICYQDSLSIYYITTKDISRNEFLKVWYSPHYAKKMKKQMLSDPVKANEPPDPTKDIDINELVKKQQKIMIRETWTCKFCGKIEKDVSQFAQHIRNHYSEKTKSKRQVVCQFCGERFRMSDIKRHAKKIHPQEFLNMVKDRKAHQMNKLSQELTTKDFLVGGGGLDNFLNDSSDNTNLFLNVDNRLDSTENYNFDQNVEEDLKEMDQFNFEIDDAQEQHVCDICLKQFSKLQYLILHLDQHTGRLFCNKCFKVFSRKKILDSHACIGKQPEHACAICKKVFFALKHLRKHINHIHEKKHECKLCEKKFATFGLLQTHFCAAADAEKQITYECENCNKVFTQKSYLKKHIKIHANNRPVNKRELVRLVCEVCGVVFTKTGKFKQHILTHEMHVIKCDTCNQTCVSERGKNKRSQRVYKCTSCTESFKLNARLAIQRKSCPTYRCRKCKKIFETQQQMNAHDCSHKCEYCGAIFIVKRSLNKHLKQQHDQTIKVVDIKSDVVLKVGNKENVSEHQQFPTDPDSIDSIAMNIEHLIEDFKTEKSKSNSVIDFNDLALDFGANFTPQLTSTKPIGFDDVEAKNNSEVFVYIYSEENTK